jgi:hypothetical protein
MKIIKSDSAPQVSMRGYLDYCIKSDNANNLYIQIVKNVNKTGKYSKENIPFSSIKKLLESQSARSITSKELNSLFETKSSNNAAFLAAVLRHEVILEKLDSRHVILLDAIAKWEAKTLRECGVANF